jgi:hypothetical protein
VISRLQAQPNNLRCVPEKLCRTQGLVHRIEYLRRRFQVRFGSKADQCDAKRHVCFGPEADIGPTSDEYSNARQDNPDLGELARLRIDLD